MTRMAGVTRWEILRYRFRWVTPNAIGTLVLLGITAAIGYRMTFFPARDLANAPLRHESGSVTNILMPISTSSGEAGATLVVTLSDGRIATSNTMSGPSARIGDRVDVACRSGTSGQIYVEAVTHAR